jgi:SPP1 gp7 family putative phage head morphogenesis protein
MARRRPTTPRLVDGMDESARALLDYLEGRRAKVRASTARRATRALVPKLPRGAELALERLLLDISRRVSAEIRKGIAGDLGAAKARAARADADLLGLFEGGLFGQLETRIARILRDPRIPEILDQYGRRLNTENAKEMERVLGISPEEISPQVTRALASYRTEVANLITSIGETQLGQVRDLVAEAGRSGMRVETLAAQIEERFRVSDSRARLIARDQTLKANAEITRVRQVDAGITRYRWSTSNDDRVRPLHADLEGTIHSWDDPPVTAPDGARNHPGQDISCRCTATPILD